MTNLPQTDKYDAAAGTMRAAGASVVFPLDLPEPDMFEHEGENLQSIACKAAG